MSIALFCTYLICTTWSDDYISGCMQYVGWYDQNFDPGFYVSVQSQGCILKVKPIFNVFGICCSPSHTTQTTNSRHILFITTGQSNLITSKVTHLCRISLQFSTLLTHCMHSSSSDSISSCAQLIHTSTYTHIIEQCSESVYKCIEHQRLLPKSSLH